MRGRGLAAPRSEHQETGLVVASRSSPVITRKCQPKALKQNHGWELRTPRRSERLEVPCARSASSLGLGFLKRQELEVLKLWQEQQMLMGKGGCLQLAPPPGIFP